MKQNYINHVALVLDRSGSMRNLAADVIKVSDSIVQNLAVRSKEVDQETRVTIYIFNDWVENVIYDRDALRLGSIKDTYTTRGQTALIDATLKAIDDLDKTATLYGDHSFLLYVVTDGQENNSKTSSSELAKRIKGLPENWTLAAFCPDPMSVSECKKFGFPANNVALWSTDAKGVEGVGETINNATNAFMRARATGVRGTKSLFTLDTTNLQAPTVASALAELRPSKDYEIFPVRTKDVIKDFVESWTKEPYRVGSAYYEFNKTEHVQGYKQICIQNRKNRKVYSGSSARQMLGLPDYEVKVNPADFGDWRLFVQSTSTNRNLIPGSQLIVLK